MDTYSHVLPTMGKAAAEMLGEHLARNGTKKTSGTNSAPKKE
jgi:hypothetical protein